MFCSKCGTQVPEGSHFCPSCGNNQMATQNPTINTNPGPSIHEVPKCTSCGNVAPWQVGPILRPINWVIGIILLFFFIVPGLIYFIAVIAIRSGKNNREKICIKCHAKNLFTFLY
jgi:ribosomal protein L40E